MLEKLAAATLKAAREQAPELITYAADLYARRHEARRVGFGRAWIDDWRPEPNDCHNNVDRYVAFDPSYKAVRGWLYFAFEDVLPYVTFTHHSVVEAPDGVLLDITPAPAGASGDRYPFLPDPNGHDVWKSLIERHGQFQHLHHLKP